MTQTQLDDKKPTIDPAEDNAFFPSPYSLSQFTAPMSDLSDADYASPYTGNRWKILMIGADERYMLMDNGTMFSTGNHPVETLVPMYHLVQAGFKFDVATLSGNPVKFEFWAMPTEDTALKGLFADYRGAFKQPKKLSNIVMSKLGDDSDYIGVFIPGGHGALMGLPQSDEVKSVLEWAAQHNKFVITLCHGPAALLALGKDSSYSGYSICAFPDALDEQTPHIGYMPGNITWKYAEALTSIGFKLMNNDISGQVHQDRKLLSGDSPLASNALGKLAATEILKEVHSA